MNPTVGIGLLLGGGILAYAGWNNKSLGDVIGGFDPNAPGRPLGASATGGHWGLDAGSPGGGSGGGGDFSTSDLGAGTATVGSAFGKQTLGRTDMGVDFTSKGALPAVGDAIIRRVAPQNSGTGWPGAGDGGHGNRGAMIVYQLTGGPDKGKYVYLAENVDPVQGLHVGQRVRAGQTVAVARGAFPYLEIGWAKDAHGTPVAASYYKEGQATPAGKSFLSFLGLG